MRSKRNSKTFILLFLGLLSAFGPFVMDMYLPTLPAMSVYFRTTSSMVQLGLTTSMAGLAAGQLFFGPLSDKYGRHPVLSVALMLFLLSTAGCIFSENILQFITLRFLQGVSGAGGVVLSRSIAADKYSARELAGVLAVIGGIRSSHCSSTYSRRLLGRCKRMARHLLESLFIGNDSIGRQFPYGGIASGRTAYFRPVERHPP